MRLLLTSASFTNEEIIKALEKLVGKKCQDIKLVTIEDAHLVEEGDLTWFEEEKARLEKLFPSGVVALPLRDAPLIEVQEMIAGADAIYCYGGNTSYLAKVFRETGFDKILPEILEEKVWVGSSAGSCVLCHKESQPEIYAEVDYGGEYMNIVPVVVLPYYRGYYGFGEKEIEAEAKQSQYPVYALSDQAALKVVSQDGNGKTKLVMETVGDDYVFKAGKEITDAVNDALDEAREVLSNLHIDVDLDVEL